MKNRAKKLFKFWVKNFFYHIKFFHLIELIRLRFKFEKKFHHEQEFLFFKRLSGKKALVIDVGANEGQSALSFASLINDCQIISFEPLTSMNFFLKRISSWIGPSRFQYHLCALGEKNERKTLFTPVVYGLPFFQESTFNPEVLRQAETRERIFKETFSDSFSILESSFYVSRGDDWNFRPDLIKIDVQGTELQVLKGFQNTIQKYSPLILMERGEYYKEAESFLISLSYSPKTYSILDDQLIDFSIENNPGNVIFIPQSQL